MLAGKSGGGKRVQSRQVGVGEQRGCCCKFFLCPLAGDKDMSGLENQAMAEGHSTLLCGGDKNSECMVKLRQMQAEPTRPSGEAWGCNFPAKAPNHTLSRMGGVGSRLLGWCGS